MQLSKLESLAYQELKKNNFFVFKIRDLRLLLNINKIKAYNLVKALKKKGIIKKTRSFLLFKDADEFSAGLNLLCPSYISFLSALNYYGFSDNMPKKIFFATTKYSKEIENFKYVTLSKKRFFGYVKIGNIVIAEKEKAIIDSLLFPKYSNGTKEILKCLERAKNELDIRKLADYGFKVESKVVLRRLGFLLESVGYKGKMVIKIRKKIGKGYELLEPSFKKKNNLNKNWLLDINW